MDLYTKCLISIFIIFPYFIFTTEFYSEFNILLQEIFNPEIEPFIFKIIISVYFVLYFICLIFGLCGYIVSDIISGFITIFNSFLFYKPISSERNKYLDYFPHLEVIYALFVGIYFIIHGIIIIVQKIKNRKYIKTSNDNHIGIIDISLLNNLEYNYNFKLNNSSFEINKTSLKEILCYFLTQKLYKFSKKKCYVTNFSNNDLNIDFIDNSLIMGIEQITIKYKKEFITMKKFRCKINMFRNKIKINIIEKGKISHDISFFKNIFLKSFYNLFKGIAVDKIESNINKKIENGIKFKQEIFDIKILFQEFIITNESFKINFNSIVEINN